MTSLIDDLLAEQRNLTAVERFAALRQGKGADKGSSHRALIPLSKPRPGEQYAFQVDLDRCSGCKSCVTACHALNGLDDEETWRSVGALHGQSNKSHQQTITTACHHCADPACAHGCPVLAYDKDPLTGIVRHLDDQCIGCKYCVLMCPYEVPKYSAQRGIVRKCDMCHQRLAQGEDPACAAACPSEAIRITIVLTSQQPATMTFSGAPDPAITRPTTRYVSRQPLPADVRSVDAREVKSQPTHLPLVWMLVLTQMGAGGFALLPFADKNARPALAWFSLSATVLGLGASVFHLGQPLKAWRFFLGWRRSWLSREVLAFGIFIALAFLQTVLGIGLPWLTAAAGLIGVFCSAMTYHATRREIWAGELSLGRFAGTTTVLGLAAVWAAGAATTWTLVFLPMCALLKLSREFAALIACPPEAERYDEVPDSCAGRSAYLTRFRFAGTFRLRVACAVVVGIALPLISLLPNANVKWLAALGTGLCIYGEWLERSLFFRAAVIPRMPGGV